MILHAALFVVAAAGGEGASCRVDADCMGGLACTTDRVCASLRETAPSREVIEESPPVPRRERHVRAGSARYRDGEAVPPGMHVEERRKLGLVIGGGVVLGVFWVLDWSTTLASCYGCNQTQFPVSFIPVLGPFIQLSLLHYRNASDVVLAPFLVINGLLQGLGAGLLLGGIFSTHQVLVYDGPMGMNGVIVPMAFAGGGAGLGTFGTF